MYTPLVSIVIPAYNASNYLSNAIDSALAQTYKNIEIIVVNDGSKDDGATRKIAESYGDKILYFEKSNGGSSSALNYGINQMKGEWFSWLSHDDRYYPKKIEENVLLLNKLDSNDISSHVVFSGSDNIDKDGKIIRKPSLRSLNKKASKIKYLDNNRFMVASLTDYNFYGCSCLIHKKLFEKIDGFDENLRLVNDCDMWFRIYAENVKIHYIPKILVSGRIHAKQISRSIGYSYHNSEQDSLWQRRYDWLKENYPNDYTCFYEYGRNALSKTRYEDGKMAFKYAANLDPSKKKQLKLLQSIFVCKACFINVLKKIYLKVKV